MKVRSLKGMNDILPPEVYLWQFAEEAAREVLEGFGYKEIRTPILEETSLFQKSIGEGTDIVNKEMYTFTDRGGRSLTLRPEGTAPIVRSYIENNLSADDLLKFYYIGPMFRSERPQKGRSRQFHQIGVEAIGSSDPYIDGGSIFLLSELLRKVGLDGFRIKLSSLGCAKDKQRLAKELRAYLLPEKNRLCEDCRIRLEKNVLRTLDCKVESCKALLRNSPKAKDFLCPDCREHYNTVKKYLNTQPSVYFIEDPNMVRGLDYYTKTVFEVTHSALGAQDAIAAGGRYDNLIEDFGGKKTPAIGFAIGIERLLMALPPEKKKEIESKKEKKLVYIATTSSDAYNKAYEVLKPFRFEDEKFVYEINYDRTRSLKAQMRQADKKKASFVAIFGDEELKRNEVILRNMKTSEQKKIELNKFSKEFEEVIKRGI